jgi:transcription elongation factor Elf1
MSKNYYIDYSIKGYPIKELKSRYGIPPIIRCELCGDSGECRNSEKSEGYDIEFSNYLDCVLYVKENKKIK